MTSSNIQFTHENRSTFNIIREYLKCFNEEVEFEYTFTYDKNYYDVLNAFILDNGFRVYRFYSTERQNENIPQPTGIIYVNEDTHIMMQLNTYITSTLGLLSHNVECQNCKTLIKKIQELILPDDKLPKINLLLSNNGSMLLKEVSINVVYDDDFIETHYNDDFMEVDAKIRNALDSNNSGLILLHGEPGTGKTSYIRRLLANPKKKMIYIPPDMSYKLTDPAFLSFMVDYPNSVLVIEDAENVLKRRQAHDGQSVANLLNMTDGIMGNILSCQIVCTFNCNEDDIDEALLRKGRLIASYKFEKLNSNKALTLLRKNFNCVESCNDMTLAEIYGFGEDNRYVKPKNSFGFSSHKEIK